MHRHCDRRVPDVSLTSGADETLPGPDNQRYDPRTAQGKMTLAATSVRRLPGAAPPVRNTVPIKGGSASC